jgi:AbrB family looped-hinge helix DNA binding protein
MELAKLTSKGQITIPKEIRKKLRLKEGDKVFFVEDKGKIYFRNASQVALKRIQDDLQEEQQITDFKSEEDVIEYIKSIRNRPE